MATFSTNPDLFLICPYDSNHKVAPRRFDIHLAKCEKTSTKDLRKCPYNFTHRIEKELFAAHLLECEDGRSCLYERVVKEKLEWEQIGKPGSSSKESKEVAELAEKMGAVGINNAAVHGTVPNTSSEPDYDDEWNCKPCIESAYMIKGLDGSKPDIDMSKPINGLNMFSYQRMTPAERRKWNAKLTEEALKKQEKQKLRASQKDVRAKDIEERAREEKQKQEEKERVEKERQEREQARKQKQKAAKEKAKLEKRAAWLARQSESNNDTQESD